MNNLEISTHNSATIQIWQENFSSTWTIRVTKKGTEITMSRRTLEQARKAGVYNAERM